MAASDVLSNAIYLLVKKESAFSGSDPDPGDATNLLYEITPDSKMGAMPKRQIIGDRAQTSLVARQKGIVGAMAAAIDFKVEVKPGTTIVPIGGGVNAGHYTAAINAAWGDSLTKAIPGLYTNPSIYTLATAGTATTTTVADAEASGLDRKGLVCSIEDITGTVFDTRQIVDVTANVITWDRALSFTSAVDDIIRPLATYAPHFQSTQHETLFIKQRSQDRVPYDGLAVDYAGVGLVANLEGLAASGRPLLHFSGLADTYDLVTTEDLDLTAKLLAGVTTPPPLVHSSKLYLGSATARECVELSIANGLTLSPRRATAGAHGRSGWDHIGGAFPQCVWTVSVLYDPALFDGLDAGTLYYCEFHLGPNSAGTDVLKNHSYMYIRSPAVQIVDIETEDRDNILYLKLTLHAVRSESANNQDLHQIYYGFAGFANYTVN